MNGALLQLARGTVMTDNGKRDWRELCQAASQEQNSEKLLELVKQINDVLSQHERSRVPSQPDFG
jgi:hypothetical protein